MRPHSHLLYALVLSCLVACHKGGGTSYHLTISGVPASVDEGTAVAPAITVSVLDDRNVVATTQQPVITLALANATLGATLASTQTAQAVAGVATFSGVTFTGEAATVNLLATAPGTVSATSSSFAVTAVPTQLVITSAVPSTRLPFEAFDVTVELRSARNTLATAATDVITLATAAMPDLLWHASGNGTRVTELVEATTATVVQNLPNIGGGEIFGAVYDPQRQQLFATNINSRLLAVDPASGDEAFYFNQNTASDDLRGLVFDDQGTAYAANSQNDTLHTVDLASGSDTAAGTFTLAGFTITGVLGFAKQPVTGTVFAIAKASPTRRLCTVDLTTGTLTDIGDLGANFSALTFSESGTLYGVTGDGGTPSETLFTIDPATAVSTQVGALGNGADGEVIAWIPRTIHGTTSVAAVGGVATFTGVYFDVIGTGYTLTASGPRGTAATSSAIDVAGAVTPTATLEFASGSSTVAENVTGGVTEITLQLSAAQTFAIPVTLFVDAASTATLGGATPDATIAAAFRVVIPAGATSFTFQVPIVDDTDAETDETLVFTLQSAALTAGFGGVTTHTLTITSNE